MRTFEPSACSNCERLVRKSGRRCGPCAVWWRTHGAERPRELPVGHSRLPKGGPGHYACRYCHRPYAAHPKQACGRCAALHAPRPHTESPDCHCRACTMRRVRAHRHAPWRPPQRRDVWDAMQDARLRQLAGTRTVPEIAAALEAEFGLPRSAWAIKVRCVQLGVSIQVRDFSAKEAAALLGADAKCVRRWLLSGLLGGRQLQPGKPRSAWAIPASAVEAFIRTQPQCYDWRRVRAGRWRSLAEGEWRRDPLYSLGEAARWLGVVHTTVRKYIRLGYLAAGERPDRTRWERWYVRRSALVRFQQQRDQAQEQAS